MKPVKQSTLDALEALTVESVRVIKALFAYEGENPVYLQKAKIGVGVIGGFSRVLASENNRAALERFDKKGIDSNDLPALSE